MKPAKHFAILFFAVSLRILPGADSVYIDYSTEPNPEHLLAYELSILSPNSKVDLEPGHQAGNRYLAYLSIVEVAPDAPYRSELSGIEKLHKNETWGGDLMDISDPAWRQFVIDRLARPAIERGFDGFFLDTVDSVEILARKYPDKSAKFRQSLIKLVKELRQNFPKAEIIQNRGFGLIPALQADLNGLLVESVFQTFDFEKQRYQPVSEDFSKLLANQAIQAKKMGLDVYVVDYVNPEDTTAIAETAKKIRGLGAVPFLTTPDLQGDVLGPQGQVARRVIVLFGQDTSLAENEKIWPEETTAYRLIQSTMEWMGYELEYHHVDNGIPSVDEANRYAGVILDEGLTFPYATEANLATWLSKCVSEGQKLLFLGNYPFSDETAARRLYNQLGLRKGIDYAGMPVKTTIERFDKELAGFEIDPPSRRSLFINVQAPDDARIALSLKPAVTPAGDNARFDAIYAADWGGAILSPYLAFNASLEIMRCYVNPFKFLPLIWNSGDFPAPDVTTKDGLRIFYTHIDGDGFVSASRVQSGKICGEVLYDEVLRDFPKPITVSIVEAEVRAHMQVLKSEQRERYEEMARKIFALPHVEVASHSYSHPYVWNFEDKNAARHYDRLNLKLKLNIDYPKIDLNREIVGSMDYIRETLCLPGKVPKIFLWSGNCKPSSRALQILSDAGYANMNGGNTIISSRFPGIAGIAPKLISYEGLLQIHASNQNEFYYTDGWVGPYRGGFRQVIETFEQTEKPRRLKPVNVYYHFYSAEYHDALAALKEIYRWCGEQDLHSLTAYEYAEMVQDSHSARIFAIGPNRWAILGNGKQKTFRFSNSAGYPQISSSKGVTGYKREAQFTYVHTNGSKRVEIQLADSPDAHPYLVSSTAPVEFSALGQKEIDVKTIDRAATIKMANIPQPKTLSIRLNGETINRRIIKNGKLSIQLPKNSNLRITAQ